jgi:ABC-type amino acid transport substrate-binding protein
MIKYYYAQENAPGFMGRHLGLIPKKKSTLVKVPLLVAYENYFYYKPLHPKGLELKGKLSNLVGFTYGAAKGEDTTAYKNANIKVKKSRTFSFFKKLKNGTIDFISVPQESVQWFLSKRFSEDKDNFVMMKEGGTKIDLCIYFNVNNPKGKKMLEAFKKGLKSIVENGKYATILEKHLKKDEVLLQIEQIRKNIN